jgi:hypothetical protein
MKNIIQTKNIHKHKPMNTKKIQIQKVCNKCKRKASYDIHEKPQKIIIFQGK